jgi:hypothetical protein
MEDHLNQADFFAQRKKFYTKVLCGGGVELKVFPLIKASGARYLPVSESSWSRQFFTAELRLVEHALMRRLAHLLHAVKVRFRITFDFTEWVIMLYDRKLAIQPSIDDRDNLVSLLYTASQLINDEQTLLLMTCRELLFVPCELDHFFVQPPQPPAYRNGSGVVVSVRTAVTLSGTRIAVSRDGGSAEHRLAKQNALLGGGRRHDCVHHSRAG